MSKSPLLNALLAFLYIVCVVSLLFSLDPDHREPSILIPMAMLSLFVLSAAVMGYLFLSQPVQMYFDGQKQEAVQLFLRTVVIFACATLLLLATLFFLIPAL